MRQIRLPFILCILLAIPFISVAQENDFEAAIGLGYNLNSAPTYDHINGNRGGFSGTLQAGGFVWDYTSLGILYEADKWGYSTSRGNIDLARPAHSFNVYACHYIQLDNMHVSPYYTAFCITAYAGYALISKGNMYLDPAAVLGYNSTYHGGGPDLGVKVKLQRPFNKFLSAFITAGTGRAFITGKNNRDYSTPNPGFSDKFSYGLQYYTAGIGVLYRFDINH